MGTLESNLEKELRSVVTELMRVKENFPKEGVNFLDFNKCFAAPEVFSELVRLFAIKSRLNSDSVVLAPEARGFILGPAIAFTCNCGFIPLRKKGKLPNFGNLQSCFYGTEYSKDAIDLDLDLCHLFEGRRVLIYDDVLATGGTAAAAVNLVNQFNPSEIKLCFMADIAELHDNSATIAGVPYYSLLKF